MCPLYIDLYLIETPSCVSRVFLLYWRLVHVVYMMLYLGWMLDEFSLFCKKSDVFVFVMWHYQTTSALAYLILFERRFDIHFGVGYRITLQDLLMCECSC